MPSGTNAKPGELARYVAAEVRAELARQGLPMARLDGVIGGKTYVSDRLSDRRAKYSLDLNDLMAIATLLGVSPATFIERAAVQMNADALRRLEDQAVGRLSEGDDAE